MAETEWCYVIVSHYKNWYKPKQYHVQYVTTCSHTYWESWEFHQGSRQYHQFHTFTMHNRKTDALHTSLPVHISHYITIIFKVCCFVLT